MNVKDLQNLTQKAESAFMLYRLPGEEVVHFNEGEASSISNNWAEEKGIVIHPFNTSDKSPLLKITTNNPQEFPLYDFAKRDFQEKDRTSELIEDSTAKGIHAALIDSAISAIKKGEIEKVVLARQIRFPKPQDFNSLNYFLRLCRWYPNTFCYFFKNKLGGCWIGASPELLFSQKENYIETISLAGTIRKNSGQIWRGKETLEQEIVSSFIEDIFEDFGIDNYEKSKLAELSMGRIAHLHNSYRAEAHLSGTEIGEFVDALQPTPAVSGFPKQKAIEYILNRESQDRKYYSGFIGEVNPEGETNLFVNLRCMELVEDELLVHVGGGITADSDAEEEWKETCQKANTLLCLT